MKKRRVMVLTIPEEVMTAVLAGCAFLNLPEGSAVMRSWVEHETCSIGMLVHNAAFVESYENERPPRLVLDPVFRFERLQTDATGRLLK